MLLASILRICPSLVKNSHLFPSFFYFRFFCSHTMYIFALLVRWKNVSNNLHIWNNFVESRKLKNENEMNVNGPNSTEFKMKIVLMRIFSRFLSLLSFSFLLSIYAKASNIGHTSWLSSRFSPFSFMSFSVVSRLSFSKIK